MEILVKIKFADKYNHSRIFTPGMIVSFEDDRAKNIIENGLGEEYAPVVETEPEQPTETPEPTEPEEPSETNPAEVETEVEVETDTVAEVEAETVAPADAESEKLESEVVATAPVVTPEEIQTTSEAAPKSKTAKSKKAK